MPNFASFAASIAELAHGEKSRTHSITHPAYLMPQEPKRLHFGINQLKRIWQTNQLQSILIANQASLVWGCGVKSFL